jgi:hypothetical protein
MKGGRGFLASTMLWTGQRRSLIHILPSWSSCGLAIDHPRGFATNPRGSPCEFGETKAERKSELLLKSLAIGGSTDY